MRNIKKSVPYKTSDKSWYYQHCLEETYKIFLNISQVIISHEIVINCNAAPLSETLALVFEILLLGILKPRKTLSRSLVFAIHLYTIVFLTGCFTWNRISQNCFQNWKVSTVDSLMSQTPYLVMLSESCAQWKMLCQHWMTPRVLLLTWRNWDGGTKCEH